MSPWAGRLKAGDMRVLRDAPLAVKLQDEKLETVMIMTGPDADSLAQRVLFVERALNEHSALQSRVKHLEEALRKAVKQLEAVGFDGLASGASALLNGGSNEPE